MQPTYRHPLQRQFAAEMPQEDSACSHNAVLASTVGEAGQLTSRWTIQPLLSWDGERSP